MSLGYIIREGVAGIRRARLAAFTSIFSLFIAVLLLGVLARVSYNAYQVGQGLKQSVDVEVFLEQSGETARDALRERLEREQLVEEVVYISKDSAAAIFRREFGMEGAPMADLDFLPASFRLRIAAAADADRVDSLAAEVERQEGVEEVEFNRQLLQMLQSRFRTVAMAGSGVGLLILLASLILVFNTIRLTIYAKRGLIKAMKLVGATNAFIRRPFVVEGMLQGLIAGVLAIGVIYGVFHYIIPVYVPQFGVLDWPFGEWYYLCGGMLLLSLLMGFAGSQWAARRFIKATAISEKR